MEEKKLREKLASKLIELGQTAHQEVRKGDIKEVTIVQISDEICTIEKQLSVAQGGNIPSKEDGKCPNCLMEYEEDAVFCANCGQNIKEYYEAEVDTCVVCNSMMKKDFNFCGICGSKKIS